MNPVYLSLGARTPIGKFNGAFADISAIELGSIALKAALAHAGLSVDCVDEVILGNVLAAGLGQNPARQAGIASGLPAEVGCTTINKVCGSGLKAVMLAAQAVALGDARVILAGGMENMTRAPYLMDKARSGYRLGDGVLIDSLMRDGLEDAYDKVPMGGFAEQSGHHLGFTREEQDNYAVHSYQRALKAASSGYFAREIVPVTVTQKRTSVQISTDEGPALFDEAKLRRLKPVFGEGGDITAGNASSINDGAAALVVSSEEALGTGAAAKILGYVSHSGPPQEFVLQPIPAISRLLEKLQLHVEDVDLFEINEAFAVAPLAAQKQLGIPHERLNVNGGAIALGHPIGASGARLLVTLLHALHQRQGRIGVVALCIGGGEAVAMAVEVIR